MTDILLIIASDRAVGGAELARSVSSVPPAGAHRAAAPARNILAGIFGYASGRT
jgi:hypothetical protein